jgi:hypothetical protein
MRISRRGLLAGALGTGLSAQTARKIRVESKADLQKRGQSSPDDGDALALTFAQPVAPAEIEEPCDEEEH